MKNDLPGSNKFHYFVSQSGFFVRRLAMADFFSVNNFEIQSTLFMKKRQYFQMVFRDQHLWVGLALIVVSLGCYFASGIFDINAGDTFSLFWVNYVLLQMYFVYLWWGGNFKSGRRGRNTFAVYLTLCLISCFSLNKSIEIFYVSADWWAIVLGLCCINNMLYAVKDAFPLKVRLLMAFMLGVSTCCFYYLHLLY